MNDGHEVDDGEVVELVKDQRAQIDNLDRLLQERDALIEHLRLDIQSLQHTCEELERQRNEARDDSGVTVVALFQAEIEDTMTYLWPAVLVVATLAIVLLMALYGAD